VTAPLLEAGTESAIRQRVAALEAATGAEVVAAVIARADAYPEIPWKAFALGASLAALVAATAAVLEPGWDAAGAVAQTTVATLAAGAAAALATLWIAPFARLFLPRERREAEVRQYAQAMFLESGLHQAAGRNGILLLVSLFEHRVVVIADPAAPARLGPADLDPVVAAITARLADGSPGAALLDGLAKLEETLATRGFRGRPGDVDEISNAVIQQRGPA